MTGLVVAAASVGYIVMTIFAGVGFLKAWGKSMGKPQFDLAVVYGALWPVTVPLVGVGFLIYLAIKRLARYFGIVEDSDA